MSRPRGEPVADHPQFIELMNQRLLAVDVFVMLQRREHHRRVVKVGHVDDHRVELVRALRKRLTVIRHRPRVRMLLCDLVQLAPVHIAETGELHHRVALQPLALHRSDAADANLENAQLAVLIDLRTSRPRKGGETDGDDGASLQEIPPGDRGEREREVVCWHGVSGSMH